MIFECKIEDRKKDTKGRLKTFQSIKTQEIFWNTYNFKVTIEGRCISNFNKRSQYSRVINVFLKCGGIYQVDSLEVVNIF